MVKVYAPASIGNVSVGFDILGAAISPIDGTLLGDCVHVVAANYFSLQNSGNFVDKLPTELEHNIVFQCWQRFCEAIGKSVTVAINLEKNMPIGSGLGSSACSVVATIVALNTYCGYPLNNDQMLLIMGEMEGRISGSIHFDNVAPCFLGGIQLILKENGIISQPIPDFSEWFWVLAYPGIKINTAKARAVLPTQYRLQDCIDHSRCLAGFIHACHTKQPILAARLMKDIIAEPYRIHLVPGCFLAFRALNHLGALACGISGSGPTLFAICNSKDIAINANNWLTRHYLQNDEGFVRICHIDNSGVRIMMD